jgi:hypothetical protein
VWGLRVTWSDGRAQRLEECLNDFIIGLIKVATLLKTERTESEEKERKRQEELHAREEKARRKEEELELFQALRKEVNGWHEARRIREYVKAVRKDAVEKHDSVHADGDLDAWITWALGHADRLDPRVKTPPSILDG